MISSLYNPLEQIQTTFMAVRKQGSEFIFTNQKSVPAYALLQLVSVQLMETNMQDNASAKKRFHSVFLVNSTENGRYVHPSSVLMSQGY